VSRDGKVIVGQAIDARGVHQAAIWQRGTEWRLLGSFPNALLPPPKLRVSPGPLIIVEANATSDDGRVIGGGQAVASSPDSDAIIWIDRKPAYLKEFLQVNGVPDAFRTWVNYWFGKDAAAENQSGFSLGFGDLSDRHGQNRRATRRLFGSAVRGSQTISRQCG
jgi:uncharacterized membrane protein